MNIINTFNGTGLLFLLCKKFKKVIATSTINAQDYSTWFYTTVSSILFTLKYNLVTIMKKTLASTCAICTFVNLTSAVCPK